MNYTPSLLNKSTFNRLLPLFLIINTPVTLGFFILRWYPVFSAKKEIYIVCIYFIFLIVGSLLSYRIENIKELILLWNTSHLSLVVMFIVLELFFSLFPSMLPESLLKFNPSLMYTNRERDEMVEYLDESPWIRFKPDTIIKCRGKRGADFTYSWKTDYLGFKNLPDIANRKTIKALALGDSFVEGMGVSVEDTWTSILSKRGFTVYNMGVQGFAPIQMVGSLKKWGKIFDPDFVIFGYTPGFERRELHFLNLDQILKHKVFTGGIQSINNYMKERRRAYNYFRVTNTIFDLIKHMLRNMTHIRNSLDPESIFYPYCESIIKNRQVAFDENSIGFKLTKKAVLDVKKIADEIGARTLVLIFVHRSLGYYKIALGSNPPENHYELSVAKAVKEFCKENGIDVIDVFPTIENYMADLSRREQLELSNLPYFIKDGHLNENGQQLVAEEVLDYFIGAKK